MAGARLDPMIKLHLSRDDARFLAAQLTTRATEIEHELIHTDKRELQRGLASDLDGLRTILAKLTTTLDVADE
jgi:hypothetical protein